MRKKCFIASESSCFTSDLMTLLKSIDTSIQFVVGCKRNEMAEMITNDKKLELYIFADRYYFGLNLEHEITELYKLIPTVKIVFVMYGHCEKHFAYRLYKHCVNAIVPNLEEKESVSTIFRNILGGKRYYSKEVLEGIEKREHLLCSECLSEINMREQFILKELATGKTAKEIGRDMHLNATTVATHIYRLRKKMGAQNVTEAVRISILSGLIPKVEGQDYDGKNRWNY